MEPLWEGIAAERNLGEGASKANRRVVAREVLEDGRTGNINFNVTESFEADTLKYVLSDIIESGASILTDKHKS